jgi:two-component system, LuxR family, response regulator FixJ
LRQINAAAAPFGNLAASTSPDAGANMPNQAVKGAQEAAPRRPIVAVVDDDPAVCSSLKFALEVEGFAVCTYCNAAEILRGGELERFDCFVIDQRMPEMNGMELIEALRSRQVSTPAILIISQVNAAVSARAAKAAIPIVEKPLLGNVLMERIREACGRP